MSETSIAVAVPEKVICDVVSHLNEGHITNAVAFFGDQFTFKDHRNGQEFNSKDRLKEFFQKARELYPDMRFQIFEKP